MHYHFKVYKENNGYWAECSELEGCNTQADTLEQLEKNMSEALNLFLTEPDDSKVIFPLPDESIINSDKIVRIKVDPQVGFAFLLRRYRLIKKLTQQEIAKKMGWSNIWSYQRFEKAKSNPSLTILTKFHEKFPDLDINLVFS